MNGEKIFGIILMTFVNLLCAGVFYGIGMWAQKRKDPMHFYSGTTVDPRTISDVSAYNRENARMWKTYSIPFWFCSVCSVASIWVESLMKVSITVLVLGCTLGGGWLILKYHKILKAYKI